MKHKKHYIEFALLGIAWLFVTIFSYTTSPLYHVWGNNPDSPIFQIIGKYWVEGAVPYKDLWDMKGPFIFFVNAVGYGLTGTKWGVYMIQCFSLFLTINIIFKTFALHFSNMSSFLMTLLSLGGLAYVYEGGNLTEEYILFPLSLSFYYILKWTDSYEEKHITRHPSLYAFIYGMVLGLSLMSRLTNALGLCAAVGVIAVTLLWHGEYKNLIVNIAMFFIGFVITTIPFFIYFYYYAALQDMWEATFLFALRYASNPQMYLSETGIHYFLLSYFNSILLIIVSVYVFFRSKTITVRTSLYFFAAAIPFVWFCQGNGYGHYGMIVYPLFAWVMMEFMDKKRWLLMLVCSVIIITGAISKVCYMYVMYHWENREIIECRQFLDKVPSLDYTSFVAYNCNPNLYLDLSVFPAVPVFSLQEMGRDRIPEWKDYLLTLFQKKQPKWILVNRAQNKNTLIIQPLLDKNYQMVSSDPQKQLELYKK